MGWPNNYAEYAYDSNGNVVGLVSGSSNILFGGQTLSLQTSTTFGITSTQIGYNLVYTGTGAGAWTITGGSTIGSTFGCYVENRGSDEYNFITLTPSSGTINGKSSFSIPYGVGAEIYSDGSSDIKASYKSALKTPESLIAMNLPLIIPSSATNISAAGILTGTTAAFPSGFSTNSQQCYMYFPAISLFTGNAAGWYYSIITGANAATVYSNFWDGTGIPTIPASPTAITTGLNTAFTQGTGLTLDVYKITIPPDYVLKNSRLSLIISEQHTNSAGAKGWNWLIGSGLINQTGNTVNTMSSCYAEIACIGSQTKQLGQTPAFAAGFTGGGTNSFYDTSVDFTTSNVMKLQVLSNTASDMMCLRNFRVSAYL